MTQGSLPVPSAMRRTHACHSCSLPANSAKRSRHTTCTSAPASARPAACSLAYFMNQLTMSRTFIARV